MDCWSGVEPNRMEKNDGVELEGGVDFLEWSNYFWRGVLQNNPLVWNQNRYEAILVQGLNLKAP